MAEVVLWVFVDADGEYGVGGDADTAKENYESVIGELPCVGRCILIRLTVPTPTPVEMTGTVPVESAAGVVLAAE